MPQEYNKTTRNWQGGFQSRAMEQSRQRIYLPVYEEPIGNKVTSGKKKVWQAQF